jgi:hypothetical protein
LAAAHESGEGTSVSNRKISRRSFAISFDKGEQLIGPSRGFERYRL